MVQVQCLHDDVVTINTNCRDDITTKDRASGSEIKERLRERKNNTACAEVEAETVRHIRHSGWGVSAVAKGCACGFFEAVLQSVCGWDGWLAPPDPA